MLASGRFLTKFSVPIFRHITNYYPSFILAERVLKSDSWRSTEQNQKHVGSSDIIKIMY